MQPELPPALNAQPGHGGAAEAAHLRALTESYAASAALHAAHAAALSQAAQKAEDALAQMRGAFSWRITLPLRLLLSLPRRSFWRRLLRGRNLRARARRLLREEGIGTAALKTLRLVRNLLAHACAHLVLEARHAGNRLQAANRALGVNAAARLHGAHSRIASRGARYAPAPQPHPAAAGPAPATVAPAALFAPSVLIIGELSLPQCAKYRVWQKREHIVALGAACTVRDWTDQQACRDALQLCARVIFYRVPGHPQVLALYEEARRLGLAVTWEVDDLIFDEALYLADRDLARLDPEIRRGMLAGAALYRRALLGSDDGIASTEALAGLMRAAGVPDVLVIENSLDADTLEAAAALPARVPDGVVRIIYGSGSKTHDGDFAVAAPALAWALDRYPQARLRIVGELAVPGTLARFRDRIEHLPTVPYRQYLALLAACDINIAPLEDTPFNSAKSNIKFVESAVLGLPSICSPAVNFRHAITHAEDGLLAADTPGWQAALDLLLGDPERRQAIGQAARRSALARYAPRTVAGTQVAALIAPLQAARAASRGLRVLAVHRRLYPAHPDGPIRRAQRDLAALAARADTAVALFTTDDLPDAPPYALRRLTGRAVPTFAMRPPREDDPVLAIDDPRATAVFARALGALAPQIVHLHDIAGLGAGLARLCQERRLPYVVSAENGWWLRDRPPRDRRDRLAEPALREAVLRSALRGAAAVIVPHDGLRTAYTAFGIDPRRIVVLPPGLETPAEMPPRTDRPLTFGYAGTEEAGLAMRCFADHDGDSRLVLVDHGLAQGRTTLHPRGPFRDRIDILPPFAAHERDAFFARIDVLLYLGDDALAPGQILREAAARGVWCASAHPALPADTVLPPQPTPSQLHAALTTALPSDAIVQAHRRAPHPAAPDVATLDVADWARRLRDILGGVGAAPAADPNDTTLLERLP